MTSYDPLWPPIGLPKTFLRFPRTSKNIAEAVLEMGGGRLLLIRERQRERERERERGREREREMKRDRERESIL